MTEELTWLDPGIIKTDWGTQHRPEPSKDAVREYAEMMQAGAWKWTRDPAIVMYDGKEYGLVGGYHRLSATKIAALPKFGCIVRQGTRRDAVLASMSENDQHGERLNNKARRNKVMTLLRDPEWREWSDRAIGEKCGVHHSTVSNVRNEMYPPPPKTDDAISTGYISQSTERRGKDGRVINVAGIGRQPAARVWATPEWFNKVESTKYYALWREKKRIYDHGFESRRDIREAGAFRNVPGIEDITGAGIRNNPQTYGEYEFVPYPRPEQFPQAAPAPEVVRPAWMEQIQENKYYAVLHRKNHIYDRAYDSRAGIHEDGAFKDVDIYAIEGATITYAPFYAKYEFVPYPRPEQFPQAAPAPEVVRPAWMKVIEADKWYPINAFLKLVHWEPHPTKHAGELANPRSVLHIVTGAEILNDERYLTWKLIDPKGGQVWEKKDELPEEYWVKDAAQTAPVWSPGATIGSNWIQPGGVPSAAALNQSPVEEEPEIAYGEAIGDLPIGEEDKEEMEAWARDSVMEVWEQACTIYGQRDLIRGGFKQFLLDAVEAIVGSNAI